MTQTGRHGLLAIAAIVMMAAISACSSNTEEPGGTTTVSDPSATAIATAAGTTTPARTPGAGTPSATATTGGTETPEPTSTSTPLPTATPTPEAIAFNVDDGVSRADHHAIALGVELAADFLRRQGGGAIERTVFVRITTSDECPHGVSARGYVICANVDNTGWRALDFGERVKVAAHEYYHVLQHELGCFDVPQWLFEGSAEYMAFRVMTDAGFLEPQAATLASIQRVLAVFGSPPALINDTSRRSAGLDQYAYWGLAVDQLLLVPGIGALRNFCADVGAGTGWEQAFLTAFGRTPSQFVASFRDQSEGWIGP
jgi:hypothetical protein